MSFELINRITIKKDGVYVSTHSNNDTSPYYSLKSKILTETYSIGGQTELDKKIIDMCFNCWQLKGKHKSIIPYINAINEATNRKDFIEIRNKYIKLDNKIMYIEFRNNEYKNISKEEADKILNNLQKEIAKIKEKRNEYIIKIVQQERMKIFGPKKLSEGIYEIIPIHTVREGLGEVYSEYMNLNTNEGTIIYEKRLGFLMQSPDIMSISEYEDLIMKYGMNEINGAKEYEKFKRKYPDLYKIAIENENKKIEEETEERVK